MNKKEALEKCLALWTWLAEHPLETKSAAYRALDLRLDYCKCPACEYAVAQGIPFEQSCEDYCPISLLRGLSVGGVSGCLHNESPYHTYCFAPTDNPEARAEARASAARQIVEAVQSDLDALDAPDPSNPSST